VSTTIELPDPAPAERADDRRVPVTVLTGFLGSGKTTLLNRILSENHGTRIAVIENEFGEIGIDDALVIGADEEVFEMNNGCICCTVRGDLIRILGNLMKRRDRFDYILVETTGMADPGPVAQTFFVDADVKSATRLDAIVTMVDAKHVWEHIDDAPEVKAQVAFADVVLLNKCDLVAPGDVDRLEQKIRAINAAAKIYRTTGAEVEMDRILDVGGFDLGRALATDATFLESEYPFEWIGTYRLPAGRHSVSLRPGPDPSMKVGAIRVAVSSLEAIDRAAEAARPLFSAQAALAAEGASIIPGGPVLELTIDAPTSVELTVPRDGIVALVTQHLPDEFGTQLMVGGTAIAPEFARTFRADHTHDASVTSVGLTLERPLNPDALTAWLRELVARQGTDIFRLKGVLAVAGDDCRWIVQGVHMLVSADQDIPWPAGATRVSQLIFIGRNLDRDALTAGFASCAA
jgi:G3E family GTPase